MWLALAPVPVVPSPKSQVHLRPAAVSALLGSVAEPVKATADPVLPEYVPPAFAVGATLVTATVVWYSVKLLSLSMIRARTVWLLGPSS